MTGLLQSRASDVIALGTLAVLYLGGAGIALWRIRAAAPRGKIYWIVCAALLAGGAHAVPLAVGAVLAGIGMMYGNTVWESALQRHIDGDVLSRVTAYDWFGSMAFAPLGLAIWGPVAEATSIGDAIWLATALTLVSTIALLAVRDVRRLQTA